jgi:hypothetical protein
MLLFDIIIFVSLSWICSRGLALRGAGLLHFRRLPQARHDRTMSRGTAGQEAGV